MERYSDFDVAEYLDNEETRKAYLAETERENDPKELLKAISDVARSYGMAKVADKAGVTREGLYRSLSPKGNPSFVTVFNVLKSIGYTLRIEPTVAN